jgi:hypothetical protein
MFDHILCRKVDYTEYINIKDIRLLGRDMNRILIIDNSPICIKNNLDNSIVVKNFDRSNLNQNDLTLFSVSKILEILMKSPLNITDTLNKIDNIHKMSIILLEEETIINFLYV